MTSIQNNASNKCMEFSLDLNAHPQEDGYISYVQEREHIIEKILKVCYPNFSSLFVYNSCFLCVGVIYSIHFASQIDIHAISLCTVL